MTRKSPNLCLSLPKCRCCGSHWRPAPGVNAEASYCKRCTKERREEAAFHFGLQPISHADLKGDFLLPRRLRST